MYHKNTGKVCGSVILVGMGAMKIISSVPDSFPEPTPPLSFFSTSPFARARKNIHVSSPRHHTNRNEMPLEAKRLADAAPPFFDARNTRSN